MLIGWYPIRTFDKLLTIGLFNNEAMHTLLAFMFDADGSLKDDFRRYPTPQKDGFETDYSQSVLLGPPHKLLSGPWVTRIERWEEQNLDRIPDWNKVSAYLDARDLIAKHEGN
jgi:hypothetical protein